MKTLPGVIRTTVAAGIMFLVHTIFFILIASPLLAFSYFIGVAMSFTPAAESLIYSQDLDELSKSLYMLAVFSMFAGFTAASAHLLFERSYILLILAIILSTGTFVVGLGDWTPALLPAMYVTMLISGFLLRYMLGGLLSMWAERIHLRRSLG